MISAIQPQTFDAGYIKYIIKRDIENSLKASGKDYSAEIGLMINGYLHNPKDQLALCLPGVLGRINLENILMKETGKMVFLDNTSKCGIYINELYRKGDIKGLFEIEKFSEELMMDVEVRKIK